MLKDIAQFLGITTRTWQNWDRDGKINFPRDSVSNKRYLTKEDVIEFLQRENLLHDNR